MKNENKCNCFYCDTVFVKRARNQRFCSLTCQKKHKHDEYVERWINRKPRKRDPNLSAKLEMACLFGQVNFLNKFNSFRG